MAERKEFTAADIAAAWQNSGGTVSYGKPIGTAKCPYYNCKIGSYMQSQSYGNTYNSDWGVDHKIALSNGGSNDHSNLQAMHHACNAAKGDRY